MLYAMYVVILRHSYLYNNSRQKDAIVKQAAIRFRTAGKFCFNCQEVLLVQLLVHSVALLAESSVWCCA